MLVVVSGCAPNILTASSPRRASPLTGFSLVSSPIPLVLLSGDQHDGYLFSFNPADERKLFHAMFLTQDSVLG